jgi:hypothetical protein
MVETTAAMPTPTTYRAFTFLVQELTMLLDSGRHDDISVANAVQHIRQQDVLTWLPSLAPGRVDLSLFGSKGPYVSDGVAWTEGLLALLDEKGGDIRRKWGIEKRGLCLLLAWTFELLRYEVDRITEEARRAMPTSGSPPVH